MRILNFELKQLCERNRDGSLKTQADRQRLLDLFANQLYEEGFRNMHANSLKPKHVEALVERWKAEGLSAGTMKNRMAALRWWAEKIGKPNVIARSNDVYGIPDRKYVTNVSKGRELTVGDQDKVTDPYTRASLVLQAQFGLRREESMKIQPTLADQGDRLVLKDSWTKGRRPRELPIRTPAQRAALAEAKRLAATTTRHSLIAKGTYKAQMERYKYQCAKAGIHHAHGHRHLYAQQRYRELTGWACPCLGGPTSRQLTREQKALDREVRLQISREMGHYREQITAVYLGR